MIDSLANQDLMLAVMISIVAAIGMNIVYSTGQLNLGQAGFFAVGAYTAAYSRATWALPLPLLLVAAAICAGIVAVPAALVTRRLRGIYFIMATLAVGEIVRIVVGKLPMLGGGLSYPVGPPPLKASEAGVVVVLVGVGAVVLMASRVGLQMRSLFDDEEAAAAAGVRVEPVRMLAVVTSAAVVGIAGGMYALWLRILEPTAFGVERSFEIALFTLIGGVHSVLGGVVGVVVVTLAGGGDLSWWPSFLSSATGWRLAVYGVLVMVIIARRPQGIVDRASVLALAAPLRVRFRSRRRARTVAGAGHVRTGETHISDAALSIRNVGHSYGGVDALGSVTLDVVRGEVLALIGANGAGKTTLIDVVTGGVPLQRGRVFLGDREISTETPEQRARLGVGRTFQNVRTFANLTVEEGVRLGGAAAGRIDESRLGDLLLATGLDRRQDALPAALTLSERRRLDIARALAGAPIVILLDEPSAGMNEAERDEIAGMILAVNAAGTTVVVVDHNLDLAFGIADRVAVLDFGELLAVGPPAVVFDDPAVRRAYLGDAEVPPPPEAE